MQRSGILEIVDSLYGIQQVIATIPPQVILDTTHHHDFDLNEDNIPLTTAFPESQHDGSIIFEIPGQNRKFRPYNAPKIGHACSSHGLVRDSLDICEACEDIEVQHIFNNPQGVFYELGWFRDVAACQRCSLCRLVTNAFDAEPDIGTRHAHLSNSFVILECVTMVTPLPPRRRDRPYELQAMLIDASSRTLRGTARIRPLWPSACNVLGKSKLFQARMVNPEAADLDLARAWIDECCDTHSCGQKRFRTSPAAEDPSGSVSPSIDSFDSAALIQRGVAMTDRLRVIDTKDACLTYVSRSAKYVTLSYVWPRFDTLRLVKANRESFHRYGALDPVWVNFPRVITDAVDVVRRLGERYLWVDALCITQDDVAEKTSLISIMDKIYGDSFLTLLVATATSPTHDYGIPGIRCTERKAHQHIANVDDLELVTALANSSEALKHSVWSTRGWTFQEGILSKRCLIFTDHQMFFHCPQDARSEDIHAESCQAGLVRHPAMPDNRTGELDYITGQKFLRSINDGHVFREYIVLASAYSRRNFTFQEDVINGFTGIMTTLCSYFPEPQNFLVGLPVSYFDQAILWYPAGPLDRRTFATFASIKVPLPSWSWLAWKGNIGYERNIGYYDESADRPEDFRVLRSMVQWWVKPHHQQRELVPLRNYTYTVTDGCAFSHGLLVASARDLNPNHLFCWAFVARFRVSSREDDLQEWLTDRRQRLPCFTLLDEDGDACGMLPSTDRAWAECHKQSREATTKEYDFLLLSYIEQSPVNSTTSHTRFFHAKYTIPLKGENRKVCFQNLMLIEYDADGIAYRRGIGRVHVDAVNRQPDCMFMKRVILG